MRSGTPWGPSRAPLSTPLRSHFGGKPEAGDVIIEEVNRLNRVVSQFLNFARPYQPDLKPRDINRVVERAVDIIRANILSEKIAIQTDLRSELPAVNADPEQLIQVILNIAMNAIEAMPEGGTLMLRTRRIESDGGDTVAITIRDTGPGSAGRI